MDKYFRSSFNKKIVSVSMDEQMKAAMKRIAKKKKISVSELGNEYLEKCIREELDLERGIVRQDG